MTIDLTFERALGLARYLKNPQDSIPQYIHIAGINGKTTVALILSRLLHAGSRLRIGTFVYPPPGGPNTCIRLNEQSIDLHEYTELSRHVGKMNEIYETGCTEYEKLVLVAIKTFQQCQCDVVVVESALGGTFDATKILFESTSRQLAAVITNVTIDHGHYLGHSLEQVVTNMLGIVRETAPVLISRNQPSAALKFFDRANVAKGSLTGAFDQLDSKSLILPLPDHQIGDNVELALRVYQTIAPALETHNKAPLCKPALGVLASLKIPQTFQMFYFRGKQVILDAAQNESALFLEWISKRANFGPVHFVLGISEKSAEVVEALLEAVGVHPDSRYSFINIRSPDGYPWIRSMEWQHLCGLLQKVYGRYEKAPNITKHTELVEILTDVDRDEFVAVFGSPYVVKDFYNLCQY